MAKKIVRKISKTVMVLLVMAALLATPGCWNRQEMESLAYILVLGIDKGEKENIKLVAQLGLPVQESSGGGGDQPASQVLVAEGRDVSEALDKMFTESTKRPFLSHVRLIVFSEKLSKEGLLQVLDFLRRDIRFRLNVKVSVSADKLEELMKVEDVLSSQPALAIVDQFNINAERSRVYNAELMDLVAMLLEPDREAVLPMIAAGEDRFTLGETAVFKGEKMAERLDKDETFGLLLLTDRVRRGLISMPQRGTEQIIGFRIISSTTTMDVKWKDDKLHVLVKVTSELTINEIQEESDVNLENRANHFIINRMRDAIDVVQREGTDFIGLGAQLRRADTKAWQANKESWDEVIKEAEFDLRSNVDIRRQGQIP